jgi:tol-pal system protein YbgF
MFYGAGDPPFTDSPMMMIRSGVAATIFFFLLATCPVSAQSAADLLVRLEQIENHMRQLTGAIEQLQYRNQQLENQIRRLQEDNEYRFQELGSKSPGAPRPAAQAAPAAAAPIPSSVPATALPPPAAQPPGSQPPSLAAGRRSDAFDPSQNPGAPGAPRPLGAISSTPTTGATSPMGDPGGRPAGAPLDLSTMSAAAARDPSLAPGARADGPLPAPPPRNPSATGAQLAALPPSQTPKDEYDLAYGYLLRKDYALAEENFRAFLKKYPSDRHVSDAQYWLGESFYLRKNYRDAADAFLALTKKYESSAKAPDALLRLGQSLAALNEKELACATFGEVGRKYPRASLNVKQAVEREQKRVRC